MVLGRMDWLDHRATQVSSSLLSTEITMAEPMSRYFQMIFSTLPSWLSLIVDTPTSEEGGPADFTFATKLQDLRWWAAFVLWVRFKLLTHLISIVLNTGP